MRSPHKYKYTRRKTRPGRHAARKQYGVVHPEGNRATRRQRAAHVRGEYMRDLKKKQEKLHEKARDGIAARVAKQQAVAHQRAVLRKEAKKGITPSVLTRAQRKIQSLLTIRQEQKKRRKEKFIRKQKKV